MMLLENFIALFFASAPWLLLGLLIGGLIQVLVPAATMSKHLGGEGLWTSVKAAFIGAPLPLCSCGVIPAALGLRKAGASKSATTAFLVATPETGVDSVTVSYALLGPFMAIVRPITAICSAIVAGVLVGKEPPQAEPNTTQTSKKTSSCCSKKLAQTVESSLSSREKLKQALSYSINDMLAGTALWLVIGLFFAALVQTYVPSDFLSQWGSGLLAMVVMVVISIPMYICATASTPIAAGLLLSGVSPGAVLVFMMAGPATNMATLGVVANQLGRRAVVAYLVGVIGTAMVFGGLTDWAVVEFGFEVAPQVGHEHQVLPDWLVWASSAVLALLMVRIAVLKFFK